MTFFDDDSGGAGMTAGQRLRVGVDVGGTNIRASVFDPGGTRLAGAAEQSPRGGDAVAASVCRTVRAAVEHVPDDLYRPLAGVGIGIPGTVDPRTGIVRNAVNLGIADLDLSGRVGRELGVPVHAENDLNVAAAGAALVFPQAHGSLAILNLGTGLGAGIVSHGRVVTGAHGVAGEIGHVSVDPDGVRCGCGQHGCLETFVSATALARLWPVETGFPGAELFRAAARGDAHAVAVRDEFCFHLLQAVEILALAADPGLIVIGGGVSRMGAPLLDGLHAAIDRAAHDSAFIASLGLDRRVVLEPADVDVSGLGAAQCAAPFDPSAVTTSLTRAR